MPTPTEISKFWGTSRPYVVKCIKRGCPTDSFENAREWREAYASSRPTTSPKQIARQLAEDDSPKKSYSYNKPVSSGNSLDDTLSLSIESSDQCFRLLKEAIAEQKDNKISVRLGFFIKAQEGRFKAQEAHRAEFERRQTLLPAAFVQETTRKVLDVILFHLAALPQIVAPRVNPHDPHRAMEILQTECTEIIADARRAFFADAD